MELADIFETELSTTVFIYSSIALLVINALAAKYVIGRQPTRASPKHSDGPSRLPDRCVRPFARQQAYAALYRRTAMTDNKYSTTSGLGPRTRP